MAPKAKSKKTKKKKEVTPDEEKIKQLKSENEMLKITLSSQTKLADSVSSMNWNFLLFFYKAKFERNEWHDKLLETEKKYQQNKNFGHGNIRKLI